MTTWRGGCHCGHIAFEVEGEIGTAMECNCSHCRPKGYLLWFVPREQLRLSTPEADMNPHRPNTPRISHPFSPDCRTAPFVDGEQEGHPMAAVNARCLQGVEPANLNIQQVDGRSF